VNPAVARPHTGYVDFYAENDTDLSWSIAKLEADGSSKKVFFEFDPLPEPVLRLALKPGHYRLSITIINRPILGPGIIDVDVRDGRVTPVRVTLIDAGTGAVVAKESRVRGTAYGYGRGTKITASEAQVLRVQTEAGTPLPYQTKSLMPYAIPSGPQSQPPQ